MNTQHSTEEERSAFIAADAAFMASKSQPQQIQGTFVDEHGTKHITMAMPDKLATMLKEYNWRLTEAENLLDNEDYFVETFGNLQEQHYELVQRALASYLRENRD